MDRHDRQTTERLFPLSPFSKKGENKQKKTQFLFLAASSHSHIYTHPYLLAFKAALRFSILRPSNQLP